MATVLDAQSVVDFLSGKKYPIPCKFKVYEPGDMCHHVLDGGPGFYVLGPIEEADEKLLNALSFEVFQIAELAYGQEDIEAIEFYCSSYEKIESPGDEELIIGKPLIRFRFITKEDQVYLWVPIPNIERTELVKIEKLDPGKS